MKLTISVRYDASVDEVRAMLTDPAFREKASWAQGATEVDVAVEDTDDGTGVRVHMVSPLDDVPAFARKIVGETTSILQEESWSGPTAAFSITGKVPVGVHGTRRLVADGSGCRDTFDGEAKAKIPVVGGKLEKLVGEKLTEGWNTEHEVGVAWLAGDR